MRLMSSTTPVLAFADEGGRLLDGSKLCWPHDLLEIPARMSCDVESKDEFEAVGSG